MHIQLRAQFLLPLLALLLFLIVSCDLQVERISRLHSAGERNDVIKQESKVLQTAYTRAHDQGTHQLFRFKSGTKADWQQWSSSETSSCPLLAAQPELSCFPAALFKYLRGKPAFGSLHRSIAVVKGGVLSAKLEWYPEGLVLQPVRAGPRVWGKPWFDSVVVDAGDGLEWYAQIRMLFGYKGEPLAFVRYYTEVKSAAAKRGDIFSELSGSVCLKGWETQMHVIHLTSIIRRIYVVPNFKKGQGHYHICMTKWDRPPLHH